MPDLCDPSGQQADIDILKPSDIKADPPVFKVTCTGKNTGKLSENRKKIKEKNITDKAKQTITELNLNCTRLVDARKAVIEKLKEDYEFEVLKLGNEPSYALNKLAHQYLFDCNGKPAEFFTAIRAFFGEIAEDILSKQPKNWI